MCIHSDLELEKLRVISRMYVYVLMSDVRSGRTKMDKNAAAICFCHLYRTGQAKKSFWLDAYLKSGAYGEGAGAEALSQGENPFEKGFSPWTPFLKLLIAL